MKDDRTGNMNLEFSSFLLAEQMVLGLLGKVLFEYPEKEWYDTLAIEGVFEEIPLGEDQESVQKGMEMLSAWNDQYTESLPQEAFEEIRDDYTRLLVGPGKVLAPPWESMYFTKERSIFQEETLKVRQWYRRFGLESVKLYNEPDDHLGLELAFIAHLAGRGLEALADENEGRFDELLDAQRTFMTNHTLKWAAGWSKLVLENARTDFFKGIALVVQGVLSEINDLLVEK